MSNVSERQARLWCLILGACAGVAAGAGQLVAGQVVIAVTGVVAGALLGLVAFLYSRGWEPARLIAVVLFTMAVIGGVEPDRLLVGVVIASTFALLLAGPWWVLGIGAIAAAGLAVRDYLVSGGLAALRPAELPVLAMLVGIMAITRFVLEAERRKSEVLADKARQAQLQSEAQAAELAQQAQALTLQNEQQRQLLDLVATLETPAVAIGEGVLLAPIIGNLDSRRAASLTAHLLHQVSEQRIKLVVLDLSGVPTVDTAVAQSLLRTVQAVQLLGCEVTLTGIAASVAATMAQLGLDFAGVRVMRSPYEALTTVREAGAPSRRLRAAPAA